MKKEKWDGKSRPSNDTYRKNFNEIFGKKPKMDLKGTIFCKSKRFFGQITTKNLFLCP